MKRSAFITLIVLSSWLGWSPIRAVLAQTETPSEEQTVETVEEQPTETVEAEPTETELEPPQIEDFDKLAEQCRTRTGEVGLAACDRALELNGQDTAVWINRGIKLDRDLADPNAALNSYYQAAQLDINQDFSLAWFNQCALLLKIARKPSVADPAQLQPILIELEVLAEETSTSATDLATPSATLLYKAVAATCDRAINGDQDWGNATIARAWNNLGYAQDELGNYGAALDAYEAALAEDPEHVGVWNNKAIALENLQRPAEALAAYERALEIDPNYSLARRNRARVLQNHPELRNQTPATTPEETTAEESPEQVIPNQ
ncbi:MAG: tetratricopeptide repeat protein [Spirulina sp. SIO3F2]|nr:tetratricopeptide repeat protein [Spirulina sp. SIO3F2]